MNKNEGFWKRKQARFLNGKKCKRCGSTRDLSFRFADLWWRKPSNSTWNQSNSVLEDFLKRCIVLCANCSDELTAEVIELFNSGGATSHPMCNDWQCFSPDVRARGFCTKHYGHYLKFPGVEVRKRAKNGEGHLRKDGYVRVYCSRRKRTVGLHRKVMEDSLGRDLFEHEEVHHKNGDRSDNRLENLELWTTSQPPGQRVKDKIAWAREFLAQYEGIDL